MMTNDNHAGGDDGSYNGRMLDEQGGATNNVNNMPKHKGPIAMSMMMKSDCHQ